MAIYFLLLDAEEFHRRFRPALAASWRMRSFVPLREVCDSLLPRVREFAARFHLADDPPVLAQVPAGLPFDRTFWRYLVGEVLWYGALEIPEMQTAEATLACLLADQGSPTDAGRTALPPIAQAHRGSRDLLFGGGFYRPDHVGWNDLDDVQRLAQYLSAVDMNAWKQDALTGLTSLSDEERFEELADARAWFPALAALHRQAAADRRVIVCEMI